MKRRAFSAILAITVGLGTALAGCGSSSSTSSSAPAASGSALAGAPSWCGSKQITLGLLDGFGGNSWRLVTTASGADEVKKCPSVTKYLYADGQGDTQKAISDIQGMVSQGVNAMVVFPDAGKAILPAGYAGQLNQVPTLLNGLRSLSGNLPDGPRHYGYLFWNTDNDLDTAEAAIRLANLNNLSMFDRADIV